MTGFRDRPTAASTVPFVVMVVMIGLLAVAQYRWLSELGLASRLQAERDLRVAVQTVAAELTLATGSLSAAVDQSAGDSSSRTSAWTAWRRSFPDLGGLYRPDSRGLALVPGFATDSLLPMLSRRIAARSELQAALALVRRGPGDIETTVARFGGPGSGPPDVEAGLGLVGWSQRAVFRARGVDAEPTTTAETFDWERRPDQSVGVAIPSGDWSLRAWTEPGSVERAAGRVRRRNLVVGTTLILVLAGSAALMLMALRQNERLATDRATVLAGISHEVRTPIAVIRSAAENLAGGVVTDPKQVREYGSLVEREVSRLEGDVEAALAFVVAAAPGAAPVDRFDLREVVSDVVGSADDPARITVEGPAAVECRGDRRALTIALRNLVANALAYSPTDQPVLVQIHQPGTFVEVSVLDRGPGIEPANRRRILEPFVRGAAGSASGRPGLGLGLALALRVATQHRGTLAALDREGGGSILVLRIPQR